MRILTWHVHGNYLYYLSLTGHELFLPVTEDRSNPYGGRSDSFPFGPNVHEVPVAEIAGTNVDCLLYQSPGNYRDAQTLLSEAQRRLPALVGITHEETRTDLARHLLGPLDSEPELLRTLLVFFAKKCSITSASKSLYIHRNTLNYRLEKISSLTGLDPRRFDEASIIRYALTIRQLAGDAELCA